VKKCLAVLGISEHDIFPIKTQTGQLGTPGPLLPVLAEMVTAN